MYSVVTAVKKPVVARDMSPGLLASAVSTYSTTEVQPPDHCQPPQSSHVCRHLTEELCHLCSVHSVQCAVGIDDCGWPIQCLDPTLDERLRLMPSLTVW